MTTTRSRSVSAAGDEQALEALYRRYSSLVYTVALRSAMSPTPRTCCIRSSSRPGRVESATGQNAPDRDPAARHRRAATLGQASRASVRSTSRVSLNPSSTRPHSGSFVGRVAALVVVDAEVGVHVGRLRLRRAGRHPDLPEPGHPPASRRHGPPTFGRICAGCPLRKRCTTSATGRAIKLTEFEQVRRDHRARAKEPDFQPVYRAKRPLVERSIAWLTRGNRRLRYRRVVKNNAWLHHRSGSVEPTSTPHLGTHLDRRDLGVGLTRTDQPTGSVAWHSQGDQDGLRRAEDPVVALTSADSTHAARRPWRRSARPKRHPAPNHAVVQQTPSRATLY